MSIELDAAKHMYENSQALYLHEVTLEERSKILKYLQMVADSNTNQSRQARKVLVDIIDSINKNEHYL